MLEPIRAFAPRLTWRLAPRPLRRGAVCPEQHHVTHRTIIWVVVGPKAQVAETESVADLVVKIVESRPTRRKGRVPPNRDAVSVDPADTKDSLTGKVFDKEYIKRIRFP